MDSLSDFTCQPPSYTNNFISSPSVGGLSPSKSGKRKKITPSPNRVTKKIKIGVLGNSCARSGDLGLTTIVENQTPEREFPTEDGMGERSEMISFSAAPGFVDMEAITVMNDDSGSPGFSSQGTVLTSQEDGFASQGTVLASQEFCSQETVLASQEGFYSQGTQTQEFIDTPAEPCSQDFVGEEEKRVPSDFFEEIPDADAMLNNYDEDKENITLNSVVRMEEAGDVGSTKTSTTKQLGRGMCTTM